MSAGRWWSPGRAEVAGRLQRRARTRPEDGVRGLHPHGKATDLAGDGDPGCGTAGAVLGECTDGEMVSPQRSQQGPRNLRPRHGWTEHRCASTPPEGRQNTPAGGSQHTTGRGFRGAATHVFRLFREGGLLVNTQDSDEDALFRQEMNYPERGAGGFSGLLRAGAGENRASPMQQLDMSEYLTASKAGSERGRSRHRGHPEDRPSVGREDIGRSIDQEDREPAGCREEDPDPPANAGHYLGGGHPWADAAADRAPMPPRHSASAPLSPRGLPGVPLPRRGESMQQHRRDRYDPPPRGYGGSAPRRPQAGYWAGQPAPPVVGFGLEAMQGMTNAMNAIANQVIRNSGRSGRNAGWPYFDGTFRDYPAFKRKFESFQMNYHRGTPTRELFQQFREMCLPERLPPGSSRRRPWRTPGSGWKPGSGIRACSSKI